jgi:hypothetical protein
MLVDTSVWVDHPRRGSASLVSALEAGGGVFLRRPEAGR